jgi:hypothetical protein
MREGVSLDAAVVDAGAVRFRPMFMTAMAGIVALLNCRRLPARLSTGETAVLLGFQERDFAPLIAAKLLAPLGKPAPNAPKYFATVDVLAAAQDRDWLSWRDTGVSKIAARSQLSLPPRFSTQLPDAYSVSFTGAKFA